LTAFTDQFSETPLDPLSALFKYLWVRFDSYTPLSTLVKVGNRITFADREHVIKENIGAADVPEVMLTFPDFKILGKDSAYDQCILSGKWTISTGTQQFYNQVTNVSWLVAILMKKIEQEGSPSIGTLGLTDFCLQNLVTEDSNPFGYLDNGLNRGTKGFACNLSFRAEITYNRRSVYNV
jgi:hypothetical protein